jgi:hypothetical protein
MSLTFHLSFFFSLLLLLLTRIDAELCFVANNLTLHLFLRTQGTEY